MGGLGPTTSTQTTNGTHRPVMHVVPRPLAGTPTKESEEALAFTFCGVRPHPHPPTIGVLGPVTPTQTTTGDAPSSDAPRYPPPTSPLSPVWEVSMTTLNRDHRLPRIFLRVVPVVPIPGCTRPTALYRYTPESEVSVGPFTQVNGKGRV